VGGKRIEIDKVLRVVGGVFGRWWGRLWRTGKRRARGEMVSELGSFQTEKGRGRMSSRWRTRR
jgi:hypothetical protein